MTFVVDVHSTENFITKLRKTYNLKASDNYTDLFEQLILKSKIPDIKLEIKREYIPITDISVGMNITVTYSPDSQKYIDYYDSQTISGKVVYVDKENDDLLLVSNNKDTLTLHSLEREHCSYYGTSRGYSYFISI